MAALFVSALVGPLAVETSPADNEDEAMNRYADGDAAAFEVVYERLAPRLLCFALRQTGERAVAEDIVQQTFLQIHRARGHFVRGARLTPWAFAIARRLIIDGGRRRRFDVSPAHDWQSEMDAHPSADAVADDVLCAKELAKRLDQTLQRLPECQRAAFELVREEGLSHAEAAEVLGSTVTAIKLRLHRANKALRAVIVETSEVPA